MLFASLMLIPYAGASPLWQIVDSGESDNGADQSQRAEPMWQNKT
jgi:hypothetical protein